jgi:hypothetical protein
MKTVYKIVDGKLILGSFKSVPNDFIEYNEDNPMSDEALALQAQAELDRVEAEKKAEAQAYLNDTDWYVTRQAETGVEIPQEVLDKRAECREIL